MDDATTGLLVIALILLGVWALVCLAGMAVLCLPFLLFYAAYGLIIGATYVGLALLAALNWLWDSACTVLRRTLARRRRATAIRRERKWTVARQREARRKIEAIFAKANADMERLGG